MALSDSVASELLEPFRAGDGTDLIRESVRMVMLELAETEAAERIGGGRYERTETRVTDRNGSRPRLLATLAGDVQLSIPNLRNGSFFPGILEPRRRVDRGWCSRSVNCLPFPPGTSTRHQPSRQKRPPDVVEL
jgi:putative transposase